MDTSSEVEAYSSAAAQKYLHQLDAKFVAHVARLFPHGEPSGNALDIGCGPGQIPIMMAKRWTGLRIVGVDAAASMIAEARRNAAAAGVAISFQIFQASVNESGRLPFGDHCFDLVTCNSVLHHLAEPIAVLNEIARVAKPEAAILIRDLRRPSALAARAHIPWFGRHYSGEMRRLYEASVRAAYTPGELEKLLQRSNINRDDGQPSRVFRDGWTHIGIEKTHPVREDSP